MKTSNLLIVTVALSMLLFGCTVVKSKVSSTDQVSTSDLYYYLPIAKIKVDAIVHVKLKVLDKGGEHLYYSPEIIDATFTPTITNIADNEQLLLLDYRGNFLSKDVVNLKINSQGLLQSANISTEDRTPAIVEAITNAPSSILSSNKTDGSNKTEEFVKTTETVKDTVIEFKNTFYGIQPKDVTNRIKFNWVIDKYFALGNGKLTDSNKNPLNNFDLTFSFNEKIKETTNTSSKNVFKPQRDATIAGIYSRPLKNWIYSVKFDGSSIIDKSAQEFSFNTLLIPDLTRLIVTPISRASFVKKEYALTFADGVLIENSITKPSQAEGFVSIPINIAKAIVSIPGQIISFKVNLNNSKKQEMQSQLDLLTAKINYQHSLDSLNRILNTQ